MVGVHVMGVHTTKFHRYPDKSVKDLAAQSVSGCLQDAGLEKDAIQALWFSNSAWEYSGRQISIRGQVALRSLGIESVRAITDFLIG